MPSTGGWTAGAGALWRLQTPAIAYRSPPPRLRAGRRAPLRHSNHHVATMSFSITHAPASSPPFTTPHHSLSPPAPPPLPIVPQILRKYIYGGHVGEYMEEMQEEDPEK